MASNLKKRGNTYFVRVAVPRPFRLAVGRSEFVRTTGESDIRLAEKKKYQIAADIQREIEALVDDDPSSENWVERQAIGIRKAVSRGEIDSELASYIIGDLREKHVAAGGKSTVESLQKYTRLAYDIEYTPLSSLVADYLGEKESVVVPSTYASKKRILEGFSKWLRIPAKQATHSGRSRATVPADAGPV